MQTKGKQSKCKKKKRRKKYGGNKAICHNNVEWLYLLLRQNNSQLYDA